MEDATTVIPDSSSSPPPPDHPVDSVADELTALSLLSADTVTDAEKGCIDGDVGGAAADAVAAAEVVEEEKEGEQVVMVVDVAVEEEAVEEEAVEKEEEEREKEDGGDIDSNNSNNSGGSNTKRGKYPVRPEAEVCSFYMKTGMCKFGLNCKFNHPFRISSQGGKLRGKEGSLDAALDNVKGNDDFVDKEGRVECKYFDRPGGCKYGKACKFNHSKKTAPASELNFIGLPIRLGERECPYYMRNGSCKFGASCRFNHPDPTSTSVGGPNALPNYSNGGSVSTPSASQSTLKSWSPASNDKSAYAPLMFPSTQGAPSRPEWSAYQTLAYQPGLLSMPQPYAMNRQPTERAVYSHQQDHMLVDEFPERPGQPECSYFLKTGTCKYKSACKFHHPKKVSEKSSVCSLSEIGLPLRPGEDICSYYGRYGICKYGPACKYDHPVNHAPSRVMTPGFGNSMVINHAMTAGS